jgi:hypothetical protein
MKPANWWLVTLEGKGHVLTADEFLDFADRVKYDEIEYEAQPMRGSADEHATESPK